MKFNVYFTEYYEAEIEADSYEACESLVNDMDDKDFKNYFKLLTTDMEYVAQDEEMS